MAKVTKCFHLKTIDGKYPVYLHKQYGVGETVSMCYIDDNFIFNTTDKAMVVNEVFDNIKMDETLKFAKYNLYIGKTAIKHTESAYTLFNYGTPKSDLSRVVITKDNVKEILSLHSFSGGKVWYNVRDVEYEFPNKYNIYKDSNHVYLLDAPNIGMKLSIFLTMFKVGDILESSSFDLNTMPLQVGNTCSVEYNKEVKQCTIANIRSNGFGVIFEDGVTITVTPNRLTKLVSFNIDLALDNLPVSVKENFETILNSKDLKVFDVTKNLMSMPRSSHLREDMVDREVDTIVCGFCNVVTPLGKPCIGCKKTYREIIRKDNRVLMLMGPDPKPNTFCIEEAKCCDNCNFFTFGYGRNGKRSTGYCDFTRQCIRSYNVCSKWFPVDEGEYAKHITGTTTNLGIGVGRYDDKDITEFNYTQELHDANKLVGQKLKKNYSVSYNNLLKKLAEDYKL